MPDPSIREFVDESLDPRVWGWLHLPETSTSDILVLTHSAGSNANAPLLVALAETFCGAAFTVLRVDLPYRQTRPYGPPGPGDAARDRAGLRNAITAMKNLPDLDSAQSKGSRIFLGGHSYGGRQSSMLCAELSKEDPDLVAGLLLLSYPLRPPRKPEQQRTQHLPDLRTPTLFVSGTRDPFGSIEELERAIKMIPAKTGLLPIEGAGHDLGFKGKAKQEELTRQIFADFAAFFKELAS